MNKPIIISGEASETDSEDECVKEKPTSVQGAVITGEDSESENENDASICSALSASNLATPLQENKYDSLFVQKLKECNVKLQNDLDTFSQTTIDDATKNLNNIDQQLLRSQLTLQNAVSALRSLSINTLSFKDKLQNMLSAKFIPNVKVDDE